MRLILTTVVAVLVFVHLALASEDSHPAHCGLYAYKAEITEVYDGDTVTANVDLGFNTWRHGEKLRLYGIDAPEVRGEERPEGLICRDALRDRILMSEVIVCTVKDKTGKYGRYLAEIYLDGENINAWMVDQKLAQPYGETPARAVQGSLSSTSNVARAVYAPFPQR